MSNGVLWILGSLLWARGLNTQLYCSYFRSSLIFLLQGSRFSISFRRGQIPALIVESLLTNLFQYFSSCLMAAVALISVKKFAFSEILKFFSISSICFCSVLWFGDLLPLVFSFVILIFFQSLPCFLLVFDVSLYLFLPEHVFFAGTRPVCVEQFRVNICPADVFVEDVQVPIALVTFLNLMILSLFCYLNISILQFSCLSLNNIVVTH